MGSKQLHDDCQEKAPFNDFDLDMNAAHLISDLPRHKHANLIGKIEIKPSEQRRVGLGSFTEDKPAKGFSIELNPEPTPADSVVTEVSSLGTSKRYKLVLHIANYGSKTVNAGVWQL
ncbi:MAG TPA: hypothetical protein VGS08_04270 [Candidatus Saccharimonadales bacterium]|nr:hypothetical protein [Candidatus Saccharimonadales bacterium]